MEGPSLIVFLGRSLLIESSESASLNIEAVRTTADYCIYHFLRRYSFSKDTAITPKAKSLGRSTAESMIGTWIWYRSFSCQMVN